jgi:AraC-type DNA-binding domain-containing proteins
MTFNFNEIKENVFITHSKKKSPFSMRELHYHNCYEIIFFLSGNISYFMKDKIYPIVKYDLVFIPPFDLHKVINTGDKYYERIAINFRKDSFDTEFINSDILNFFTSDTNKISAANNDMRNIFNLILYERKINDNLSNRRIKLLLEELLIILNREVKRTIFQVNNNTIKDEKVLSIISYINENYMNNISLSLLSDKFYISQSYLAHLFKDVTSFTIMEYLNEKRISMAQQMLSEGNYNISIIGELVGYNNLTSFSRTFKKIAGISPMQYKNQYKFK